MTGASPKPPDDDDDADEEDADKERATAGVMEIVNGAVLIEPRRLPAWALLPMLGEFDEDDDDDVDDDDDEGEVAFFFKSGSSDSVERRRSGALNASVVAATAAGRVTVALAAALCAADIECAAPLECNTACCTASTQAEARLINLAAGDADGPLSLPLTIAATDDIIFDDRGDSVAFAFTLAFAFVLAFTFCLPALRLIVARLLAIEMISTSLAAALSTTLPRCCCARSGCCCCILRFCVRMTSLSSPTNASGRGGADDSDARLCWRCIRLRCVVCVSSERTEEKDDQCKLSFVRA